MYGQRAAEATPVFSDLAAVQVGVITDRSGQLLRNELVRLLNPAADSRPARYTLIVVLKEAVDTFAVESSGFATTASVEVVATYSLIDEATGNPVLAATSQAVSGYNLLDNASSTYVATGDAHARAIEHLAFDIRNRLAAYFASSAKSPAGDT